MQTTIGSIKYFCTAYNFYKRLDGCMMLPNVTPAEKPNLTTCPECNASIPVIQGFVTWCSSCNWNLKPDQTGEPKNLFEKIYISAGRKTGDRLLQSMIRNGTKIPKFSISRILAICAASIVHLISLGLFAFGCFLIIRHPSSVVMLIYAAFFLTLAWVTRPRMNKLPSKPLSREQYPVTYQIFDEITSVLHSDKIDYILINSDYNAFYTEVGLKQRKAISLGLPLLSILDKQETVALVSHEIAHGINGDINRHSFLSTAIHTLATWHALIKPERYFNTRDHSIVIAIGMFFANLLLGTLALLMYVILFAICHLNWRDSQRAEYMADACAAEVAGSEAKLSLLKKLYSGNKTFEFSVLKVINNKTLGPLLQEFRRRFKSIPDREIERLDRLRTLTDSRLDATHPVTAHRIAFIRSLDAGQPLYQLSEEKYEQFINELSSLSTKIETEIMDNYKRNVLGI
ncbi:hypothetical protein D7Z26_18120 [Cohnella endophytica]|uniref:Peptidase M48 domain-containing protein n=1 Tax=Cohnella endophytica TaxID=2419778 RepID=A0A494XU90_9BACL|nr:M48 family metallopeptidase [Cohnella endophytica]RKP51684.1 hypothetical protein D7Z26_18120 [Cohnella endophytica]